MFNNSAIPITSNYVISSFDSLSLYARIMSQYPYITQDQRRRLLISADNLENIRTKWQRGSGKCISQVDIDILQKFGDLITSHSIDHYFSHNSIYERLEKTWRYLLKIQDNDVPEVITGRSSTPSSPQPLNLDKLQAAKENSNLMFEAVRKRTQSINNNLLLLDISTVLLTIIIRSEAHEYTLGNILRRLQAITRENIDVAELLSVERKVPKAESFKPDTRAIRDATAHARFDIISASGDFAVHFKNTEDGYAFERTYSRKELLDFYEDYDRMTLIVSRLLYLRLLHSFLNLHFRMD
jgi:succinate dehydrogenase flavin-adding protein (antitoxin of CptAB toxin-antitoxin module)